MSSSTPQSTSDRPLAAIILAAGKGTRMDSDLPKVAIDVAGQPIVAWVVDAVRQAGASRVLLVVGHEAQIIRDLMQADDITFVDQVPQDGTAHAVECCREAMADFSGDVLVLAGDGPLLQAATIETMLERHCATNAAATLATSVIDDPTGYGRIVRDDAGRFAAIVEHRSASEEELAIHEVYPSYAVFDAAALFESLTDLEPDPRSGEYYLTALPQRLMAAGSVVEIVDAVPPQDVLSINTPQQLSEVEAILKARLGEGVESTP